MKALKVSLFLLLCVAASSALACPGCKDALSSGSSVTNPWGAAYNWSIMFMLAMVLTMAAAAHHALLRVPWLSRAGKMPNMLTATPTLSDLPRAPRVVDDGGMPARSPSCTLASSR